MLVVNYFIKTIAMWIFKIGSESMSYYGRDGGKYDNIHDVNAANQKFEQNKERNRLLKEQNDLLKMNSIMEANLQKEKFQHEKEMKQMENESQKELMLLQIEHDKEMRILSLFDDAGLSKESYDQFINMLFLLAPQKAENDQLNKFSEDYKKQLKDIDKYYEDPQNNFKYIENILIDCMNKKLEYYDMKNKLQNYLDEEKKNNVAYILKYFKNNKEYKNKRKSKIMLSVGIFVISMILAFLLEDYSLPLYLVGTIIAVIYLIRGLAFVPTKEMIEKELELLQDKIDHMDKYHNFDEQIKDRKKTIEDIIINNEINNEIFEKRLKIFEKVWAIFVEFREEHYNNKIEKILIETGVKDKVEETGLSYKKINNSNKIKDGTIEEYEIFFDEAINTTKEELNYKLS